jgi:hypothetical protein
MKKLTNLLFGAITCLLASSSLQAQPTINFSWKAAGPDNVSGRSRTVLVDNQNSSRIFAGSAGGGLWISNNGGTSWQRAEKLEAICVNALVQDENGTLYIGSGEGINSGSNAPGVKATFGVYLAGYQAYSYGIRGHGIYKMVSKDSFELLEATKDWKEVNRLAYDNANHTLYAACDDGLQYSTDYGTTWKRAKANGKELILNGMDVKTERGVVVYAEMDRTEHVSKAYLSSTGPEGFSSICGKDMIADNAYRIELAIAPSDTQFIYASAINTEGDMINFYLSDNMGKSFRIILPGGSTLIDMYNNSGFLYNSITVFPENPKHILIGGYPYLWEAQEIQENTYYSFVKLVANSGTNAISFDPNNKDVAYLSTNIGIAQCTFTNEVMTSYVQRKKNMATSQITSMSVGHNGAILAGSVDNGTLHISTKSNTEQTANSLTGASYSGESMLSVLNTNALFYATTDGQCFRQASTTSDPVKAGDWYAGMMVSSFGSDKYPKWKNYILPEKKKPTHSSLSPMVMWETTDDPNATEEVVFKADKHYEVGDSVCVKSNTAGYPMWVLTDKKMDKDSTWKTIDRVQNRIFIGGGGFAESNAVYGAPIYMTKGGLDFTTPPTWYRIFFTTDTTEQVTKLCVSEDGNYLYASTFSMRTRFFNVYRFSGFNTARDSATLSFGTSQGKIIKPNPSYKLDYAKIYSTNTDFITSIYVNPYNNDELIMTFSGGDVMVSSNATSANDTVALTLTSKNGNGLPDNAAFYSVVVLKCDADNANNKVNSDMAMIGTEEGAYYTENFNSNNPDWYLVDNGIGSKVPVIQLIQQRHFTKDIESHYYAQSYIGDSAIIDTTVVPFEGVTNHGWIYAATYGRGIFYTDAFGQKGLSLPSKKASVHHAGLDIYPNPTRSEATVSFRLDKDAQVSVRIFDLSGRNISTQQIGQRLAGENTFTLRCADLSTGIYFIQIKGGEQVRNGKLVVTK